MAGMKKECRVEGRKRHHEEWMDISMFSMFSKIIEGILLKVLS